MAANYPDVIPMIAYEDGPKAMDWLSSAFGFKERTRMLDKGGRLSHGEMQAGDGVIMLASPTPDYHAPRHHRESCEAARKWSAVPYIVDGVLVYVDDVDAHFARAKLRGAAIISDIEATSMPTSRGRSCEVRRSSATSRRISTGSATARRTSKAIAGCSCSGVESLRLRMRTTCEMLIACPK